MNLRKAEQTTGDGNCAFNAFALALADPIVLEGVGAYLQKDDKLKVFLTFLNTPDLQNNIFIKKLKEKNSNLNELTWENIQDVISNFENRQTLQAALAPILRQFTAQLIETTTIPSFKEIALVHYRAILTTYKTDENEARRTDLLSQVDPLIANEIKKNISENNFKEWWNSTGYTLFLKNIETSGQWAGDFELKYLANYFGVELWVHKDLTTRCQNSDSGLRGTICLETNNDATHSDAPLAKKLLEYNLIERSQIPDRNNQRTYSLKKKTKKEVEDALKKIFTDKQEIDRLNQQLQGCYKDVTELHLHHTNVHWENFPLVTPSPFNSALAQLASNPHHLQVKIHFSEKDIAHVVDRLHQLYHFYNNAKEEKEKSKIKIKMIEYYKEHWQQIEEWKKKADNNRKEELKKYYEQKAKDLVDTDRKNTYYEKQFNFFQPAFLNTDTVPQEILQSLNAISILIQKENIFLTYIANQADIAEIKNEFKQEEWLKTGTQTPAESDSYVSINSFNNKKFAFKVHYEKKDSPATAKPSSITVGFTVEKKEGNVVTTLLNPKATENISDPDKISMAVTLLENYKSAQGHYPTVIRGHWEDETLVRNIMLYCKLKNHTIENETTLAKSPLTDNEKENFKKLLTPFDDSLPFFSAPNNSLAKLNTHKSY